MPSGAKKRKAARRKKEKENNNINTLHGIYFVQYILFFVFVC
jgi:hypothetical protein